MVEQQINVLVIEDNPGDMRLIKEALTGAGDTSFNVVPVDRLSMALKRLNGGGIDVVLLDLGLPDSLGLDSFTSVHDQAPDVPVVVLSGLDHQGVAGEAVRAGAHVYMVKSQLVHERLDQIIKHAIDRQQMRRDLTRVPPQGAEAIRQAETARQHSYDTIAAGGPDASSFPADATLFALCADYRDLALDYLGASRVNGHRPSAAVHQLAQRLAEIRAGGHHVVRLHQRSLAELVPDDKDRIIVEDARVLLVDVMARLIDIYLKAR